MSISGPYLVFPLFWPCFARHIISLIFCSTYYFFNILLFFIIQIQKFSSLALLGIISQLVQIESRSLCLLAALLLKQSAAYLVCHACVYVDQNKGTPLEMAFLLGIP